MILPLEKQVTNLEISRRIKELGVKQDSLFSWVEWHRGSAKGHSEYDKNLTFEIRNSENIYNFTNGEKWSAFTIAEIERILPKRLFGNHPIWYLTIHCNEKYYYVDFETFSGRIEKEFYCEDENGANAMGMMLIYLLENKLI